MEETEPDHRHFEEAAPIYATGGLDPKEREEFEAHLQTGCSVCFDLLKELQPTNQYEPDDPELVHSETLKKISHHDRPSDERPLRSRVIREQDSQTGLWSRVRTVLTSGVLAVALVVLAGGSLWYALNGRTDLSHLVEERQQLELDVKEMNQRMERLQAQIKDQAGIVGEIRRLQPGSLSTQGNHLTAKIAEKEKENTSLLREVTEMAEYEAFVRSSRLLVVPLVGKGSSDPKGFFFYDAETSNAWFYTDRLPPLPPGAVYQIWALIGKPVGLGAFRLDDGKIGRLWLPRIVKLPPGTRLAVSVERGGGALKPTGEVQLLGELRKAA